MTGASSVVAPPLGLPNPWCHQLSQTPDGTGYGPHDLLGLRADLQADTWLPSPQASASNAILGACLVWPQTGPSGRSCFGRKARRLHEPRGCLCVGSGGPCFPSSGGEGKALVQSRQGGLGRSAQGWGLGGSAGPEPELGGRPQGLPEPGLWRACRGLGGSSGGEGPVPTRGAPRDPAVTPSGPQRLSAGRVGPPPARPATPPTQQSRRTP